MRTLYTNEESEALINMVDNSILSQVSGDSAKSLVEWFPKVRQDRQSLYKFHRYLCWQIEATGCRDYTRNHCQSECGEFVGVVADNLDQPIELKAFDSKRVLGKNALDKEKAADLRPSKVRTVTPETIDQNYEQIKQNVQGIEQAVFEVILNDPAKQHLLVSPGK